METECPLGWQHYNSSCYFFSSESLNWYLAQVNRLKMYTETLLLKGNLITMMVKELKMIIWRQLKLNFQPEFIPFQILIDSRKISEQQIFYVKKINFKT